jgi:hypothetical protein
MDESYPVPSPANITEVYNQVRAQIQHEDNLLTQRQNWFLTSQSFLFTAFAIVLNGTPEKTPLNVALRATLLKVIPLLAILVGLLILIAIIAGASVMQQLRREFRPYQHAAKKAALPPLQGSQTTRMLGIMAPITLPAAFIAVWLIIILRMLG